ncbi:hypothetical protein BGZ63DRAFT_379967 [Mariannaea sp. PMI_226]|nr:hypothetical protein BGZ63DRAFT_379967 [Mariannaea sp. PMI_226]
MNKKRFDRSLFAFSMANTSSQTVASRAVLFGTLCGTLLADSLVFPSRTLGFLLGRPSIALGARLLTLMLFL